jgi:hypothetical protein
MDKEQIIPDEHKQLQRYSFNVVKSIGGMKALENAIDLDYKTLQQNLFLGEIYDTCMESAKACARRNVDEEDCKKRDLQLASVMDRSALTETEYKKFAKRADGMNLDEVAKIIKDKTMAVIKDEQEQYEKEQELDEELKAALKPDTDTEDVPGDVVTDDTPTEGDDSKSLESFMDIYLDKNAPRHHVTVFSRLQETAMEMMSLVKVGDSGNDYFPIIYKTTYESFFKDAENLNMNTALESATHQVAKEEVCEVPEANRPKYATLVSIVVYTMMETLKTMGIYCPSQGDIQKFVNKSIDATSVASKDSSDVCDQAKKVVNEAAMMDFSKMNSSDLSDQMVKLKTTMEILESGIRGNNGSTEMINIASEATNQITVISEILHQRDADQKAASAATESFYSKRQKINDLAQFNRIGSMFGKNPLISEIQLRVNPDTISSIIDVHCANESGAIVRNSYMNMEYACEESMYLPYLKDTFEKSNLKGIDKHVSIIMNDGKGTKIALQ